MSIDGKECKLITSPTRTVAFLPHCVKMRPIVTYIIDRGYEQHKQIGMRNFFFGEKTEFRRNFNSTRISADGSEVIFSCSGGKLCFLFTYNLNSGKAYRLTNGNNILMFPLVILLMGKNGLCIGSRTWYSQTVRSVHFGDTHLCLSQRQGRCLSPAWSTCGKWIAFVKRIQYTLFMRFRL